MSAPSPSRLRLRLNKESSSPSKLNDNLQKKVPVIRLSLTRERRSDIPRTDETPTLTKASMIAVDATEEGNGSEVSDATSITPETDSPIESGVLPPPSYTESERLYSQKRSRADDEYSFADGSSLVSRPKRVARGSDEADVDLSEPAQSWSVQIDGQRIRLKRRQGQNSSFCDQGELQSQSPSKNIDLSCCSVCGHSGTLLTCGTCAVRFHSQCLHARLQTTPQKHFWECAQCSNGSGENHDHNDDKVNQRKTRRRPPAPTSPSSKKAEAMKQAFKQIFKALKSAQSRAFELPTDLLGAPVTGASVIDEAVQLREMNTGTMVKSSKRKSRGLGYQDVNLDNGIHEKARTNDANLVPIIPEATVLPAVSSAFTDESGNLLGDSPPKPYNAQSGIQTEIDDLPAERESIPVMDIKKHEIEQAVEISQVKPKPPTSTSSAPPTAKIETNTGALQSNDSTRRTLESGPTSKITKLRVNPRHKIKESEICLNFIAKVLSSRTQ
ncbi:hypothetical protein HDU76_013002 [Blyttiomyces sp. JEL0837]|nr:hypothetical protein HDU76_013002 [Blyttiomyces sp. JEL0837]